MQINGEAKRVYVLVEVAIERKREIEREREREVDPTRKYMYFIVLWRSYMLSVINNIGFE